MRIQDNNLLNNIDNSRPETTKNRLPDILHQYYDQEIIDRLLDLIHYPPDRSFSTFELDRLDLYCYFLEEQRAFMRDLQETDPDRIRILRTLENRIHRQFHDIISQELGQGPSLQNLSRQNIACIRRNLDYFLQLLPLLSERYDVMILQRFLKNENFFSFTSWILPPTDFFTYDAMIRKIETSFGKEIDIRRYLEVHSYETLRKNTEFLIERIGEIPDGNVIDELIHSLALKAGITRWLAPQIPADQIRATASLFQASREGTTWAEAQITPPPSSHETIHEVFFLQKNDRDKIPVAVFKNSEINKEKPSTFSGAMEALVYDIALIFGLEEGLVPTKIKTLFGKKGSIQPFEKNGVLASELFSLPVRNRLSLFEKLSLEDFLKGAIPALLFANQDLHTDNFFIVEGKDGQNKLKIFDNEYTFPYSNDVILSSGKECWLPFRCGLLVFPHADYPITGELKKKLQEQIKDWEYRYTEFLHYLQSPCAAAKLKLLAPHMRIDVPEIDAFFERISLFVRFIREDRDFTFRDLVLQTFPFYTHFFKLEQREHPYRTELMVGTHSAEFLHRKLLESNPDLKEYLDRILSEMHEKIAPFYP